MSLGQTKIFINSIWYPWVEQTSTTTTIDIWPHWTATATTQNSIAITSNIYTGWVTAYHQGMAVIAGNGAQLQPQETPGQRAERDRLNAEHQAKWETERALRKKAEERALELLIENLSLQQRLDLKERGHFFVNGRSGCRYRIRKGQSGNIDIINERGIITHRACVHPSIYVPDSDAMLGQKLRLEHDDVELIRIANRTVLMPEAPVLPALQ